MKDGSIERSQAQAMTPLPAPTSDGKNGISATAEHPRPNSDVPGGAKIALSPPTSNIESGLRPASVSSLPLLVSETQQRQQADPSPSINSRASSSTGASSTFKRGDYLEDREFGVDNSTDTAQLRAKTLDSAQRRVEGGDASKGNGGVVAAIRDKYTRATGPASPPPRDLPRLPLSVATIATKYQSENSSESSRWQTRSPINDIPHRSRDPGPSSPHPQQAQQFPSISSVRIDMPTDELVLRRQRIEDLEDLERRERGLELRAREREALQRERDEILRSRVFDGYSSDSLQNRTMPPQRPHSQVLKPNRPPVISLTSGRSHSTTSLLPPGTPTLATNAATQRAIKDVHLPDCQCPACTVARYAETPLSAHLRPPQGREKSKADGCDG
ncbi:hypothetical protein BGY98DRAFT_503306 [Russula aff. rugulosa BPL654]|nr:hypothetical protein BGY98DRAFT_503306 [Russula aff. rugulosa BPL654]